MIVLFLLRDAFLSFYFLVSALDLENFFLFMTMNKIEENKQDTQKKKAAE